MRIFLKRLAHQGEPSTESPSVIELDGWEYDRTRVFVEWKNIDILVRDDSLGLVAVIENKIDASEHSGQLQRYRGVIERHFPNHRKLLGYLTIHGEAASDEAYAAITYEEIVQLIEVTLERRGDQIAHEVAIFLSHYSEMLRRHIVQDSEIQELCRQIYESHRLALDVLFEHRPNRVATVREEMDRAVAETDGLIADFSHKNYVRFIPEELDFIPRKGSEWTRSGRMLIFELDQSGGGLKLKLTLGPGDEELRNVIAEHIAATKGVFNRSSAKVPKQWWGFHIEPWVGRRHYEESDEQDLIDELKARFDRFVKEELPQMVEALMPLEAQLGDFLEVER